jgi:hypothetical protein
VVRELKSTLRIVISKPTDEYDRGSSEVWIGEGAGVGVAPVGGAVGGAVVGPVGVLGGDINGSVIN